MQILINIEDDLEDVLNNLEEKESQEFLLALLLDELEAITDSAMQALSRGGSLYVNLRFKPIEVETLH